MKSYLYKVQLRTSKQSVLVQTESELSWQLANLRLPRQETRPSGLESKFPDLVPTGPGPNFPNTIVHIILFHSFVHFYCCSLFPLSCSPFTTLYVHPDSLFFCLFWIPLCSKPNLLVLYKYWPLPNCIFSSLVIMSLLLVSLALSNLSQLSSLNKDSAPIIPWSLPSDTRTSALITHGSSSLISTPTFNNSASAHCFQLAGYTLEVILLCPDTSFRLSMHLSHLVMALTKYPEVTPNHRPFGLSRGKLVQ